MSSSKDLKYGIKVEPYWNVNFANVENYDNKNIN